MLEHRAQSARSEAIHPAERQPNPTTASLEMSLHSSTLFIDDDVTLAKANASEAVSTDAAPEFASVSEAEPSVPP